jgi:hypothetical protein
MYKPDETAEGIAIAKARQKDPSADKNSQSIVIHPLLAPKAASPSDPKAVEQVKPKEKVKVVEANPTSEKPAKIITDKKDSE